jgi:molybdopterin converting factor small subunit
VAGTVEVTIEFYGIPRERAGRSSLPVAAVTVRDALNEMAQDCPALRDVFRPDGCMSPHYLLSVDGTEFVGDLDRNLRAGERLLLLSADVGG